MSDDKDFERKIYGDLLKISGEKLDRFLEQRKEKRKNLKQGDNVVQFNYYHELISESEIIDFKGRLNKDNLDLSYYDLSGDIQASAVEEIAQVYVNANILEEIVKNVTWDGICFLAYQAWKMSKEKIDSLMSTKPDRKLKAGTGLHFKVSQDKAVTQISITFQIENKIGEKIVSKGLKELPEVLKNFKEFSKTLEGTHPVFRFTFRLSKKGNWKFVEVAPDIFTNKGDSKYKKKK
jgi:hypothetical protein